MREKTWNNFWTVFLLSTVGTIFTIDFENFTISTQTMFLGLYFISIQVVFGCLFDRLTKYLVESELQYTQYKYDLHQRICSLKSKKALDLSLQYKGNEETISYLSNHIWDIDSLRGLSNEEIESKIRDGSLSIEIQKSSKKRKEKKYLFDAINDIDSRQYFIDVMTLSESGMLVRKWDFFTDVKMWELLLTLIGITFSAVSYIYIDQYFWPKVLIIVLVILGDGIAVVFRKKDRIELMYKYFKDFDSTLENIEREENKLAK